MPSSSLLPVCISLLPNIVQLSILAPEKTPIVRTVGYTIGFVFRNTRKTACSPFGRSVTPGFEKKN